MRTINTRIADATKQGDNKGINIEVVSVQSDYTECQMQQTYTDD